MPGMPFTPFSEKNGAIVAAGDFDGDNKDEIIIGNAMSSSEVRVFSYSNGVVSDTGIDFMAYESESPGKGPKQSRTSVRYKAMGVNVAAADLNGDGLAELITAPAVGNAIPVVKVFSVNTSDGPGKWTVELMYSFNACNGVSATQMTTGDIDADGVPEILVVCRKSARASEVREFKASGEFIRSIDTGDALINYIAAGDTSMDGKAEIILGSGPSNKQNNVKIIDAVNGAIIKIFQAFTGSYGVRVSVGDLGY
jgi:hypothetical protein